MKFPNNIRGLALAMLFLPVLAIAKMVNTTSKSMEAVAKRTGKKL